MSNKKVKGIIVELGGDATNLNKAIKSVSAEARDTQSELKKIDRLLKMDPTNVTLLKQKQELLNESIEKTEDVVTALKAAKDKVDQDMANGTEVNEKAYRELERQIEANEITLRNTRQEADKVAAALNGVDDAEVRDVAQAAEDAEEALEDASKEAADFGDVLKAGMIVEAAEGIAESLKNVVEETKEYRKIMGSLDVSSDQAGYSAEQTEEAYKKLYGVLADDQSAATTVANLQALGLSQEQLMSLIQSTIGGWAKYGDSIPIDGLAEAVNETVKAGQVTGTFADILNWGAKEGETYGVKMREATEENEAWNKSVADCETAEDFFNLALQNCSTEAERVNLVMQAMADQGLAAAGAKWEENNASMVAANQAQADFADKTAQMAERVEPAMTAIQEGSNQLLQVLLDMTEGVDWTMFAEMISSVFDVISALIIFLIENHEIILSVLAGIGAGLAALKLAELVNTLSSIRAGVNTVSAAFPALGSAISLLTNPIFLVTAAVVALVALIATKGDEIQAILQKVDAFLQGVFATNWTNIFGPVLGGVLNEFFAALKSLWDSIYLILNGVIDFIRGVFTGDWERVWLGVREVFGGIFSGLIAIAKAPINAIIGMINSAIGAVNWLITGLNRIPGVNIGMIGTIPMLANGGTVWSGSAIVGEAGPELLTVEGGKAIVQPLTMNTGKMEGLLESINGQLGSDGDNTPIVVQVVINEKVVGEAALNYSRRVARANGR